MIEFFSINTVFFTVLGYPMSYLEFFGTTLNLWCVYLAAKNKILNWPVGIAAVVLFFLLFYQIRLYSDMFEQAYFFFTGFWGWWMWARPNKTEAGGDGSRRISRASRREALIAAAVSVIGGLLVGALMSRIHLIAPTIFPAAADYPYLDAFTMVMSFVATVLMMRRRVDCWHYWITVDVIGVWLYFVKDVKLISLEYLIFLAIAVSGFLAWRRDLNHPNANQNEQATRAGGRQVLPAA